MVCQTTGNPIGLSAWFQQPFCVCLDCTAWWMGMEQSRRAIELGHCYDVRDILCELRHKIPALTLAERDRGSGI